MRAGVEVNKGIVHQQNDSPTFEWLIQDVDFNCLHSSGLRDRVEAAPAPTLSQLLGSLITIWIDFQRETQLPRVAECGKCVAHH